MKSSLKWLAVVSAAVLLTACETPPGQNGDASGAGGAGGMNSQSVRPGSQEDLVANVGDRVFFDTDSSVLTSEGQRTLERQAAWLQQYPNNGVTIEGHCDERGTREYNIALGERRATAARKYLSSLGVKANRISITSYGKERPAVVGSDDSAYAQNRRAVTVVTNQ